MTGRAWVGVVLVAVALGAAGQAAAQDDGRRAVARELARLMVDDASREAVHEEVGARMTQFLGATLQERLHRRLLDVERDLLTKIVSRFVGETLPPSRTEELAAEVYVRHFDEGELRELLRFQQSAVGRKARRLAPVIARQTAEAMDRALGDSPALPRLLEELRDAFPILGPTQSP